MTSIIASAQTTDHTILFFFGKTCALEFYPKMQFMCINETTASLSNSPFQ